MPTRSKRTQIAADATPEHRERVFWHEWAHSVLSDSGVGQLVLDDKMHEALCDAFSTARVAELRKG